MRRGVRRRCQPAAEVEAVAPRRPTVAKEPSVIIYQDSAVKRPQAPKRRAAPARREAGISSEERAYLERATDPDASVRIYSEKELAARDSILGRLKRLFGGGDARNPPAAQAVVRAPDALVYEDQTLIEEELPLAKDAHGKADDIVKEVIADLNKSKTLDLEKVGDAVGWMVQSVVRNPDGLIWLARLKSVDAYTYDHGLNSAIYLIAFGRHLGLPEDQLQVIGTVGLMQDIGKVKVPPGLLEKRAKLTLPERSIIQSHVSHSVAILSASKDASQTLIDVVREHHERYDGSGYPKGLAGEQISMLGGMAGLVDTYTAMISVRSYAQPMSVQRALHELYTMRDRAFKASLVEEFIQCVGVFPVGSLVELNTTEVAVVVSQNRSRRLKPRVMLVMDANRQPFAVPAMLDLVTDPPTSTGEIYRIVRGLQAGLYDVDPRQTLDAVMGAE